MNDKELDKLMKESLERREMFEGINKNIMQNISHAERKNRILSLTRMLAFAFGLPLILIAYALIIYRFIILTASSPVTLACVCISGLIMIAIASRAIAKFSSDGV